MPLHTGVRTGCNYLGVSAWLSVCVRVTFVVCNDCEICMRLSYTNPGSMEVGEYGLTRGTCFVVSRLEVAVVAGLLWISWFVRGGADLSCVFFFSSKTHGLLQV